MKDLKLPISASDAASLMLGEIVTVSGLLFTGRSRFHIRAAAEDIYSPLDYERINCFFHVGPVMKQTPDGWEIVSIEPTSSIRFERYGADVVRKFKLRTLIGKITMGGHTAAALKEVGGVYLSQIGLSGNLLRKQVKKLHQVYFLHKLGKTEATWVFAVENFGPFFVAIDVHGNNYFENLAHEVEAKAVDCRKYIHKHHKEIFMKLYDLALVSRSKNAGPFQLTIDLMFHSEDDYRRVLADPTFTRIRIGALYNASKDKIFIKPFDRIRTIKVVLPRCYSSGAPGDTDVYGCQQHFPLGNLQIGELTNKTI